MASTPVRAGRRTPAIYAGRMLVEGWCKRRSDETLARHDHLDPYQHADHQVADDGCREAIRTLAMIAATPLPKLGSVPERVLPADVLRAREAKSSRRLPVGSQRLAP